MRPPTENYLLDKSFELYAIPSGTKMALSRDALHDVLDGTKSPETMDLIVVMAAQRL
jgi:hypothetical protein